MNANNNRQQAAQQHRHSQSSFFVGAPLAKLIVVSTLVMYFTANARELHNVMRMNATRIRDKGEVYRYWSSKVSFLTNGEFFLGMTLFLFLLRKFEREMGSRKMVMFCIFVVMGAIALEAVFVHSALLTFNYQYSGPYALIGALFCLFHQYTPRLYPSFFSILGVKFSEKVFYYLWFAAVAGANGWNSALAVAIGWMVALLYQVVNNVFQTTLDVPEPLAAILSDIGSRISEAPPPILVTATPGARGAGGGARRQPPRPAAAAAPAAATGGGGAAAAAAAQAGAHPVFGQAPFPSVGGRPNLRPAAQRNVPPPAADPAAVEQLVNMGFSRPQVIEALQSSNNNVQDAAERLLTQL